jgi:alanine racemase
VVEPNSYGHGAVPVAKALFKAGADWLGVACVAEGIELRDAGIQRSISVLPWGQSSRMFFVRLGRAFAVFICNE